MKVLCYSDIHLEFGKFKPKVKDEDYDIVVLAGDIAPGKAGIAWAAQTFDFPYYVAGNHEFYGRDLDGHYKDLDKASKKHGVCFMHNDALYRDKYRVLGCTLWTSYDLDKDQVLGMLLAEQGMNDYVQIKDGTNPLRAKRILSEHIFSVNFLVDELSKPFDGKTIVVTHMAPSAKSVRPRYSNSRLNHCYASNLDWLIERYQPDLWVHGHMHESNDYMIGKTRVVSNPRGYVNQFRAGPENVNFREDFIIEL